MSSIMFASAFYFGDWIDKENIMWITIVGTSVIFSLSVQDVAVDSWSVTLLHPKNVAYASFC